MSEARVKWLATRAKMFRGTSNDELIRQQIKDAEPLMDHSVDPRAKYNLDGTRIGYHKERVDAWMRGEHIAPITIDMALTQRCSYSCCFCYAGLQQNPAAPVAWTDYDQFLEDCVAIGHKPDEGVKAISLVSDGESTENPDFIRFIRKAKSLGIDVASGTNGLKLTDFDTLVDCLSYLRFNFNAADPKRNAEIMGSTVTRHYQVIENIRSVVWLKRHKRSKINIGLQMVLLPEYADQVIPLALLGRELGVDYLVIKHCSDDEEGRLGVKYEWYKTPIAIELFHAAEALSTPTYSVQAKWSKFATGRDRKYSKCFGTPFLLQMSGTGIVAPCGSFFHERYKRYWIGDIKTRRFKDIWDSPEYREVMKYLGSDEFDPRKQCATLCLQDRANVALFDYIEKGIPLPEVKPGTPRVNFI